MPTGTPIALKCPKCRRGQYGHARQDNGVRQTGTFETTVTHRSTRRRGRGPRVYPPARAMPRLRTRVVVDASGRRERSLEGSHTVEN